MNSGLELWVDVKQDNLTPETICKHCCADPDECGEYPECCYNAWVNYKEHDGE